MIKIALCCVIIAFNRASSTKQHQLHNYGKRMVKDKKQILFIQSLKSADNKIDKHLLNYLKA